MASFRFWFAKRNTQPVSSYLPTHSPNSYIPSAQRGRLEAATVTSSSQEKRPDHYASDSDEQFDTDKGRKRRYDAYLQGQRRDSSYDGDMPIIKQPYQLSTATRHRMRPTRDSINVCFICIILAFTYPIIMSSLKDSNTRMVDDRDSEDIKDGNVVTVGYLVGLYDRPILSHNILDPGNEKLPLKGNRRASALEGTRGRGGGTRTASKA